VAVPASLDRARGKGRARSVPCYFRLNTRGCAKSNSTVLWQTIGPDDLSHVSFPSFLLLFGSD
jgi:hypothetical protein